MDRSINTPLVQRSVEIGPALFVKGYSVSILWRGGEVDTIYGFETEYDSLQWIKDKSRVWLIENKASG
jgi:hypothetical protein